ncbi:site-specific integrase [Campylobacter felis]|uniref:tyrosine-type recombinase/integrase n=1 Tax=Campylobacter TaxID=194 RepID=UPI0022EB56F3|nr:site-specific integrase [Campylobacter upsaliensis]MDL0107843.1 site-specific integrase [Campylobacter felis]
MIEKILNSTLYERNGVWYIDASIVRNGTQERLRFSTSFAVDEMKKQSEQYALLKELKTDFVRLYLKKQKHKFKKTYEVHKKRGVKLFKNVAKDFLDSLYGLKPKSKNSLVENIRPALSFFEWHNITDIDKEEIEKFFNFLDEKNISICTKKHYAKTLNRVLCYALENELIEKNPFKMRKWRDDTKEIQAFSHQEIQTLLTQSTGEIGIYLKIALLCGARTGEILALQWKHIDFKNKKIIIEQSINSFGLGSPKTANSRRIIDLLKPLFEFLKQVKEQRKPSEEDFIFKGVLKPYIKNFHKSYLRVQYIALLSRFNIAYRPIYNTRHSFASFMLSKGENLMWVSWMMGHKNTSITLSFYSKYLPSGTHAEFLKSFLGGEL